MSAGMTVRLTIDGRSVESPEGTNVLRAAERAGIPIPHFCYHPAFEAEGSCRMCLVEVEGLPKLELACSTLVKEGLIVRTATPRVLEARKDVLEFLLAEHPLDCPICDKAGECRLQDYYDRHGRHAGRFVEPREKREKKVALGRGLILDRERCILCTRCVRFLRKVTGTGELGVFERGIRAEVGTYDGQPVDNNYSGNLVDLCPVGAITGADFRFKTRAWFLEKRPTVCPGCGRGCAAVVESVSGYPLGRGERRVYRVSAAEEPAVNGWWLCDLGRAVWREVEEDRARGPVRPSASGERVSWAAAVEEIAGLIRAIPKHERERKIAVILNSRLTCEELASAKRTFVDGLGASVFVADPRPGEADGFLLTAERVPNSHGVVAAGLTPRLPELDALRATAEILLLFGPYLLEHHPLDELSRALADVPARFLFLAHRSPLEELAGLVLPLAVPAEKAGSFINIDGLRRSFSPAVPVRPGALAEGEIIRRLAAALGLKGGEDDVC